MMLGPRLIPLSSRYVGDVRDPYTNKLPVSRI